MNAITKNIITMLLTVVMINLMFMNVKSDELFDRNNPMIEQGDTISCLRSMKVFVTVYRYKSGRSRTADGSVIRPNVKWCAVSRDILANNNLKFGDTLIYKDIGYAIRDLTHKRLRHTVDILMHSNKIFAETGVVYFK